MSHTSILSDAELLGLVEGIVVEDLRQDCLVALLERRPRCPEDARRIIQRVRYRHQWDRRQERKRTSSLPDYDEPVAAQDEERNALGAAYDAVCKLPEQERNVVLMRYVLDMSATETAKYLGVNRRSVHRWTVAAFTRLRKENVSLPRQPAP